jgi:sensor c-di-GMP phosphodiesterase-like protein
MPINSRSLFQNDGHSTAGRCALKRSQIIILLTVLLIVVCTVLPLAGMLYFAWQRAVSDEQANLTISAQTAIQRANIVLNEARVALHALEPLTFPPCSEQHIAQMRQLTVNTRSIEEIAYFDKDGRQCSSWGQSALHDARPAVDFTTSDGLQISLRVLPASSQGKPMVAIQYQDHHALAMPARFTDVIVDPGLRLVVATEDGHVLGQLNSPDPALVKTLLTAPGAHIGDDHLAAVVRQKGMIAIVLEPRSYLFKRLHQEQLILLPVGLLIAILMIALLIWVVRRRLSPLGELALAVRKREFVVHYQPILDLNTGHCVGAEALVRWQRPDGSMVRPDHFIPLAEESGLVLPITDQVIESVVRELGPMLVAHRSLHIAVNLSASDIKSGRALGIITKTLSGTGIASSQIWLEATERGFVDVKSARSTLDKARDTGHSVSIDDFGTGYSSLSHLQTLPLDALKIDKSFVDTIGTDSATSSVTPHIIGMAKTLGLKIVAEGVETAAQADYLRNHQVDYAQGWLFAKAMPANAFIVYCQQHMTHNSERLS